jgi:hypothetical protein
MSSPRQTALLRDAQTIVCCLHAVVKRKMEHRFGRGALPACVHLARDAAGVHCMVDGTVRNAAVYAEVMTEHAAEDLICITVASPACKWTFKVYAHTVRDDGVRHAELMCMIADAMIAAGTPATGTPATATAATTGATAAVTTSATPPPALQ